MVKRDFSAWSFIEQKPKIEVNLYCGSTILGGSNCVTYGITDTLFITGCTTITHNNLTTNTIQIDRIPNEGEIKMENNQLMFYLNNDWVPIRNVHFDSDGDLTFTMLEPKKSRWKRFIDLWRNL